MKKLFLLASLIMLTTPAIAKDTSKVVAIVNGTNIYSDSVDIIYKEIPENNIQELGGKAEVKKIIIDQLASAEALKQEAIRSNVSKSENFKKLLELETEKMIQEEYLRVEVEKRVTDKEIKETYNKALEDFRPAMEYNVYNILSKTEKDAQKIIKQLNKGADFQKLAIEEQKGKWKEEDAAKELADKEAKAALELELQEAEAVTEEEKRLVEIDKVEARYARFIKIGFLSLERISQNFVLCRLHLL
jgi:peptidyl-prolyl cis-trans isomerase C